VFAAAGDDPQPCFDDEPIQNSDAQEVGYLGTGIDADGDVLTIGASTMDLGGVSNRGAAYIYWLESGQWVEKQQITPDVTTAALFGESVAMSGDLLAVAAPSVSVGSATAAGVVYIYRRDASQPDNMEWELLEQEFLTAGSEVQVDGSFGGPIQGSHQGVAMDDRLLVVGSPGFDVDGEVDAAGKAYIFLYDPQTEEWSLEDTLESDEPTDGGRFGQSVAISGTRIIVGEYGANKAHVFKRNSTTLQWEPDGSNSVLSQTGGDFGWSVAIDDAVAVAGANLDDTAYVYRQIIGTWQSFGTLSSADEAASDFGSCVSVDGTLILVGARGSFHPDTGCPP
jgi:hypothetical protein